MNKQISEVKTVINPETGRKILVGGPTWTKLMLERKNIHFQNTDKKSPKISKLSHKEAKEKRVVTKIKKLPGCSAFGKYKVEDGPFCGPEGKACENTYPVGTKARLNASIRYAREAPKPEGIIKCAVRKGLKMGFLSPKQAKVILDRHNMSPYVQKNIARSPKKRSTKK
jgi:hypothetical protein